MSKITTYGAAGKVTTGFSKPYVALYGNSSGTVSYSAGQVLARGVSVSLDIQTAEDNNFYADNVTAESANGRFTGGNAAVTVDGLLPLAEKLIMGLADPEELTMSGTDKADIYYYGDGNTIPYMGFAYVRRWMCDGVTGYNAEILTKVKFAASGNDAATQEEDISWQTKALTATLHRDDSDKHRWRRFSEDYTTEAEAEAVIKKLFDITT